MGCGKELSCKLTLARHMKIHREDDGIWEPCMECDKQYRTKRALNDHIAIVHRGQKNYACNECGKAFGRQNNLIDHVKRKHSTPISPSYIAQLEKSTAWLRDNGTFGQIDTSRIPEYTLPRINDSVMQFAETESSGGSSQDWRGLQPPPTSSHFTYPDGNVGTTQSPIL